MDESDGDKLRTFLLKSLKPMLIVVILGQSLFASDLGGYSGTSMRFTADPMAAGTGGITLFQNTSTNSYSQNPASLSDSDGKSFNAGMVSLPLDRFIYTVSSSFPLPPTAHIGIGLIAAGTKNIQARDSRGFYAGEMNDTEISYLVSFSNSFSEKLAFGLSLKILSKQMVSEEDWFDLKGSGFGAGVGISYKPTSGNTFAVALKDWNSSYNWKTQDQKLYEQGSNYQDVFPVSLSWGWLSQINTLGIAIEHDYYLIGENIFRAAIMWQGLSRLQINAGFSYEDGAFSPGTSFRYVISLKQRYPMHLDFGIHSGVNGEGLRNYLGWGLTF